MTKTAFDESFNIYLKLVGNNIKQIRVQKGMSQLDLSVECNMEKSSISRIERGGGNITLKTLIIISNSLNVNLFSILRSPIDFFISNVD